MRLDQTLVLSTVQSIEDPLLFTRGRAPRGRLLVSLALLCLTALAVLPVSVARATPSSQQRALARELYTKGQQLFREGDYVAAEHSFEEAYRVAPTPIVLLSIAECQVRTEQFEHAADTLETYLREKPDAKDRNEVRTQIETLRHKPAALTVSTNIAGADIWVDGNDTGMSTPADLSLSPGVHTVTVVRDGYVRAEQSIRLSPAGRDTIRFTMMPEAHEAAVAATQTTPSEPAEAASGRHTGTAFWVATGVGIAAVGAGVGLGVTALMKEKAYDKKGAATEKKQKQGDRIALSADICYGIATAAAVTALVLYLTSGSKDSAEAAPQQAWRVAPSFSHDGAGLAARAEF
jgi:tetratricopeptide (TPR) repeat protein